MEKQRLPSCGGRGFHPVEEVVDDVFDRRRGGGKVGTWPGEPDPLGHADQGVPGLGAALAPDALLVRRLGGVEEELGVVGRGAPQAAALAPQHVVQVVHGTDRRMPLVASAQR